MQAGMLLGAAAAAKSFERTLMPRKTTDQGAVTGLSVALTYATTAVFQELIENTARYVMRADEETEDDRVRRATMLADLLAIGAGAVLSRQLKQQENESLGRAGLRTGGNIMSLAGIAGFSAGFVQDVIDVLRGSPDGARSDRTIAVGLLGGGAMAAFAEYRRRRAERSVAAEDSLRFDAKDWQINAGKSLVVGLGVTAGLGGIAAAERLLGVLIGKSLQRGLAGDAGLWHLAGHASALAMLAGLAYAGLDRVYQDIEAGTGKIEPAYNQPPESPSVSGSAGSHVPWRTMGREGRRHVLTVLSREAIAEVMGVPAKADPIRVFVGLESARSEIERVSLAMQELHRTGAFDRELLVAVSPTGTGYVNYVTIECCEYMTLGNCATVTLQYSKRPSPLSMDRVWEGRKQFRMLLAAIRRELYKRDPDKRPRLVVFGESLGAHTSQDAFLNEGTQGLEDAGVERALWIGSPHLSKWKAQVLGEARPDVERAQVTDVDNFDEIAELPAEVRDRLRYVMLTHHNDGVGLFGADLIIQQPAWLGEPDLRPAAVPGWMRWSPIITAVQTVIDMKNAMNVVPGEFVANGHDYRADLARFVRAVYGLQCTDAQLERIETALRKYELLRQARLDDEATAEAPEPEQTEPPQVIPLRRAA
jgi:uncharacterized membrane protein